MALRQLSQNVHVESVNTDSRPELHRKCIRRRELMEQAMIYMENALQFYTETLADMGQCDHEIGICMCECYEQMKDMRHILKLFHEELY